MPFHSTWAMQSSWCFPCSNKETDTSSSHWTFTLTSYPSHIPLAVLQGNLKENEFTITLRWKERTDQKIEGRSEIEASFLRVEKSKGL